MKKYISFLCSLVLIVSCTEETKYEIPKDANGQVILFGMSTTTSNGISTLDDAFSVTATLPNAQSGDVMDVEVLQLQEPVGGGSDQLLPLTGTLKTVTVGSDLKATVSYTRTEANLNAPGDFVVVIFEGETEYAKATIEMEDAASTTKPMVSGVTVDVARTAETAYFNVEVNPKSGAYTGTLVAKRKNGINDPEVDVTGSPFSGVQPFLVPISGTDFAAGKDTMYYEFTATSGSYTDKIEYQVIVRDPYFFLKKTGVTLTLGGSSAGRNILINKAVSATDASAILAVDAGSLTIHGGVNWAVGGKEISFVPSDIVMYNKNSSTETIAAFEAGTPTSTADPIGGAGIYIYKAINGPNPTDVFYGMIKVTAAIPGTSVTLEYRIGDQYAHLSVIK